MSYKSMTVCLDNSAGSSRRLDFALALAARHGAQLLGLHLTYAPVIVYDPYAEMGQLLVEWEESIKKKQDYAKEQFYAAAQKAGINYNWAAYRSSDLNRVIAHARASDLTIIGQRDPKDGEANLGNSFHEILILKLGRPVLILPNTSKLPENFAHVIVAWDGGREAARAMADAMPFLKQARLVRVLTIKERIEHNKDLPDIDIASYLAKHDIRVEIERVEKNDIAPADWLLSRVTELGADLLVMGAYGHNRLTELLLGGVTRSVMRQMTIPVLMSH